MKNWMKKGKKSRLLYLCAVSLVLFLFITAEKGGEEKSFLQTAQTYIADKTAGQILDLFLPFFSFATGAEIPVTPGEVLSASVLKEMPIYGYSAGRQGSYLEYEDSATAQLITQQGQGNTGTGEEDNGSILNPGEDMIDKMAQENSGNTAEEPQNPDELAAIENEADGQIFTPHEKTNTYDWESMKDYATLISTFYAIDANTMMGSEHLDVEKLTAKDLRISKEDPAPQILIYHTHSLEGFSDSVPGDPSQTVVGVGDRLAQILTEQYGYGVLHHTGEYDTVRDEAYAKSLPAIEALLKENPTIEVVIDLHRDAGVEGVHRAVEIDGRKTATFMLFNGVSRTKKTGDISYLKNPNLQDNLAFSFQMQVKAGEYYPGLTRKIYLKGYRYNMHLMPRYLLIELGDENNTLEEALNTCEPLAHILDMVLSGNG